MTELEVKLRLAVYAEGLRHLQGCFAALIDEMHDSAEINEADFIASTIGSAATSAERLSRNQSQRAILTRQLEESLAKRVCRDVGGKL